MEFPSHCVNTECREQTCSKEWQLWPCSKEAHVCLGSSGNKSQLGEERRGIREKGRWAHSDICRLWDMPAPRKQFRDEQTDLPQSHVQVLPLTTRTYVSLMASEIKHLALRNHLKPQSQREDERVSGWEWRELNSPRNKDKYPLLFHSSPYFTSLLRRAYVSTSFWWSKINK